MPENVGRDSQNLLSTFMRKERKGRDYVVQQSPAGLSIRKGKRKLIPAGNNVPEWAAARHSDPRNSISTEIWPGDDILYNLKEDPDESHNLANKYLDKVEKLKKFIKNIRVKKTLEYGF